MLEFHDSTDAVTHLPWSRTSSWSKQMRSLRRLRPCLSWNSKHWSNWFSVGRGPTTVRGWPRVSPAYFRIDNGLRLSCTRMSMDIRVHIGRNPRSQHEGKVRKLYQLHLLTINAPLIVKDEVDKVFELILFVTKQKIMWGLRLIEIWDLPPSRGPWRAPGQVGPWLLF